MKSRFIIIVLFLTAISISAQSIAIGPQVGYVKTKDADKGTIMPGIAARANLLFLTVEGSIGYKSDEYFDGKMKVTNYPVLLTGFMNLIPIVHAEAGIGWYNYKTEYSGLWSSSASETGSNIGYHAGIGAELPLGNILLTGDIRYVFMNLKLQDAADVISLKSDYYVIAVGLLFKL